MFVIKNKKIFISISIFLVLASWVSIIAFGLPFGLDFKGGSRLSVVYENVPTEEALTESVSGAGYESAKIEIKNEGEVVITLEEISDAEKTSLISALPQDGLVSPKEEKFTTIGPSIGNELKRKAISSMILVILSIIVFIAISFRKVSAQVSSWKYGMIAIFALIHDVSIPTGIVAILGHFGLVEIDSLFIVAILTILGLSVSDTIVVFDRIREKLKRNIETGAKEEFENTVGKSLSETFGRSLNTSLTVILALLSLVFFGPESTRFFAIILTIGMFFGTYSSIFLASPLLVIWNKKK
jgi:preprotein translocase subunit SecF